MPAALAMVLSAPRRSGAASSDRTTRRRPASATTTKATRRPSGESAGQRSAARPAVKRRSVPPGSLIHRRAALPRPRPKRTRPPASASGVLSSSALPRRRVGAAMAPVSPTATCQTSKLPPRFDAKSSDFPSFPHDGSRSHSAPEVTRDQLPVGEMIQRSPRTLTARRPSAA